MKFLDKVSLSGKLQIYLSVFLAVCLLFLLVFFVFQFNALVTAEQEQMLADAAAVSSRLLSSMTVQHTLLTQVAEDTQMRDFVMIEDFYSGIDHSATIGALFLKYLQIESTMSGGVLRVAKDSRTMNAYPVFSMTLQETLQKEWLDPKILDPINYQRVFWAVGDLDGSDCLICYRGIFDARELTMVVLLGIELNQINNILYNGNSNADMLMVSPDLRTVVGNGKLEMSADMVAGLLAEDADGWTTVDERRYMVSTMQVSGGEIGVDNWRFAVVRDPQSFSHDSVKILLIWMAALVSLFVLLTLVNRAVTRHIVRRCYTVVDNIKRIAAERYTENSPLEGQDEFAQINEELVRLSTHLDRLITDEYKRTMLLQQEQITSLQNQINPHYIVNTLEAIRMKLLIQGEEESSRMVQYLAESLRTYAWDPRSMVTIREELDFLERYMTLQNYRFLNKITYHVEIEPEILTEKIPHFILQPLIENAIQHGFKNMIEHPHLEISFVPDEEELYIIVSDNGLGMSEEKLAALQARMQEEQHQIHSGKGSIGILNVYWRIKLLYGDRCYMQVKSKEGYGTEIEIKLQVKK